MKWRKLGLVWEPQGNLDWTVSHAMVPIAEEISPSRYRIYFSSRDHSNRSQTGYLEIDIREPGKILQLSAEPVVRFGKLGTFDEAGAMGSWIETKGNRKYLYYIGWNLGVSVPFRNAIGLAVSDDGGKTFSKYSEGPLLDRNLVDAYFLASACVLHEQDVWHMWYVSGAKWELAGGKPKHWYHIRYAASEDGIQWSRRGQVCIDFASAEEYALSRPCVLREQGVYKMWYSYRGDNYRIGYAESCDGLTWERKDEESGIDVSASGWDSEMIEYPFIFDHAGTRYMLYNGNGYGKTGIGLAVLETDVCPP